MNFKDFEDLFELAANQARAIHTLYSNKCIKKPTFADARESLSANLRMILSGAVPIYKEGIIHVAEDKPACIDAYRTIALFSREYDARINALESLDDLTLIESMQNITLPEEVHTHEHEPLQVVLIDALQKGKE